MLKTNLIIIILYLSFIALGLPDALLGVAWPNMRLDFAQPLSKLGFLIAIGTLCSAISSYMSGYIIKKLDMARIVIISNIFIIAGLTGYIISDSWVLIIISAIPFGLGAGAIDSVLNNYAAKNLSSRHVNWLHGCWGIGTTIGPMILTMVYASNLDWRFGFGTVIIILLALLGFFILTKNIWQDAKIETQEDTTTSVIFNYDTILSSLFFGIYVSLEFSIGLWYYSYLVDYNHLSDVYAGAIISMYWGVFTIGRFIIGYITKWVSDKTLITSSLTGAFGLLIVACFDIYHVIPLIGITLAAIYPCMVNVTHKRFSNKIADSLMGMQVGTANLALVVLVPAIGFITQKIGLQYLPVILVILSLILIIIDARLRRLSK